MASYSTPSPSSFRDAGASSQALGDMDYPLFKITAQIGNGSPQQTMEYWLARVGQGQQQMSATNEAAFLSAIKSFFESHSWSGEGSGYTIQTFTVLEFAESSTDVTPS